MMQLPTPDVSLSDAATRLMTLMERLRDALPFVDDELACHRALSLALNEQRERGEHALSAWREALSRRWECEVLGQRIYSAVQRQLSGYYGDDTAYSQLIAPAHAGSANTASDLLQDMRRLEGALELVSPRPPFAQESLLRLRSAGDALAEAITWTDRCETERRCVLTERRLATNLYQRAYDRTRRLLTYHVGEQAASLPSHLDLEGADALSA